MPLPEADCSSGCMGHLFHWRWNQLSRIEHVSGVEGVLHRAHKVQAGVADLVAEILHLGHSNAMLARQCATKLQRCCKDFVDGLVYARHFICVIFVSENRGMKISIA